MRVAWNAFCRCGSLLALGGLVGLTGCAILPRGTMCRDGPGGATCATIADAGAEARALKESLMSLAPTVSEAEAGQVAACAFGYSRRLAGDYRAIRPAWLHNCLVNVGIRKRGLCYQWAEDLQLHLQKLELATLELHWGMARSGTLREHNCVVVTACGQPFELGVSLDAWRRSGRLVWKPVSADKYPWIEGSLYAAP